jgi:hypothetical protein
MKTSRYSDPQILTILRQAEDSVVVVLNRPKFTEG